MKYPTEIKFIEVNIDIKNSLIKGGYIFLRSMLLIEIFVVTIEIRIY